MTDYMKEIMKRGSKVKLVEVAYEENAAIEPAEDDVMNNPAKVYEMLKDVMKNCDREKFVAVHVNTKMQPICVDVAGIGNASGCLTDIAHIARAALMSGCTGVILAHNHPSGNADPSEDDLKTTKKIKKALGLLDIKLLDHVIIGRHGFRSMMQDRIL